MMEHKQLTDYPEYVKIHDAVQALQSEKAEVDARLNEIAFELSKLKQQQQTDSGARAWKSALEGEDSYPYEVDNRSELRGEQQQLEGRLRFVNDGLELGLQELDKVRGRCSLEICLSARPQFVLQTRRILESLKVICDAHEKLRKMRESLQADDVRTGSLAPATFNGVDAWDDPCGSRVTAYRSYVAENYPELPK
jgi:hypothetical protein